MFGLSNISLFSQEINLGSVSVGESPESILPDSNICPVTEDITIKEEKIEIAQDKLNLTEAKAEVIVESKTDEVVKVEKVISS